MLKITRISFEHNKITKTVITDPKADTETPSWLHFSDIGENQVALRQALKAFNIHDLVIDDIFNPKQNTKIEHYTHDKQEYTFLAMRIYMQVKKRLTWELVYLIVCDNTVMTFQRHNVSCFMGIDAKLEKMLNNPLRNHITGYVLAYHLLNSLIDKHHATINRLAASVEKVDKQLFTNTAPIKLEKLHRLRQDAEKLQRTMRLLQDNLRRFLRDDVYDDTPFDAQAHVYYRAVLDYTTQMSEQLNQIDNMINGLFNIFFNLQSSQLNHQMRLLTVITILFMPLTVITGIYGMNFEYMPELKWHYGYFTVLGVMLCILVGLLLSFKRKNWL